MKPVQGNWWITILIIVSILILIIGGVVIFSKSSGITDTSALNYIKDDSKLPSTIASANSDTTPAGPANSYNIPIPSQSTSSPTPKTSSAPTPSTTPSPSPSSSPNPTPSQSPEPTNSPSPTPTPPSLSPVSTESTTSGNPN